MKWAAAGFLLLLIATFLWLGSAPVLELSGKWVGTRPIEAVPGADASIAKTLSKVSLHISANRKFALFERGLPKTGRVQYSRDSAVLEIIELAGKPLDRQPPEVRSEYGPIELTLQENGTLLYHDPKLDEPPLFLKKV